MPEPRKRPASVQGAGGTKRREAHLPRFALTESLLNPEGLFCAYRMHNDLPPSTLGGKLLALPEGTIAFARASSAALEMECKLPFLLEHEHGLAIDLLDPSVYDVERGNDAVSVAVSRTEAAEPRRKPVPEAGGFLRKASYIVNDVYTLRDNYFTGHDGAEKKLMRARRPPRSADDLIAVIHRTFADAKKDEIPHPNPKLKGVFAKRVHPMLPDTDRLARRYAQVAFDENPMKGAEVATVLHPRGSASGPTSKPPLTAYVGDSLAEVQATLAEGGVTKLARQKTYLWDNRWLCELELAKGSPAVRELLLTLPGKEESSRTPVTFILLPGLVQRCSKEKATGTKTSDADQLAAVARMEQRGPSPEEIERQLVWDAKLALVPDTAFDDALQEALEAVSEDEGA